MLLLLASEVAVQGALNSHPIPRFWMVVLDPLLLALLSCPVIHHFAVRPARRMILQRARDEAMLRESAAQFGAIFEHAPIPLLLVDGSRLVRRANRAAGLLAGDRPDVMVGTQSGQAMRCIGALNTCGGCGFGPACPDCAVRRIIRETFQNGRPRLQVEATLTVADGDGRRDINLLLTTTPLQIDGEGMVLLCMEDITARKAADAGLREANANLHELTAQLDSVATQIQGLMDDVAKHQTFSARFENPLLKRCWEARGCDEISCPAHGNEANLRCWEVAGTFGDGEARGSCARELKDCRRCDIYKQARTHAVFGLGETFNTMIAILSERDRELRSAASTDALTGLPNRVLLLDRLQQIILRRRRCNDVNYAVLFLDFDRFKTVNDSLGHDVGDQLLQDIASRLRSAVRAVDSVSRPAAEITAARFGGDEFVVLLDGLHSAKDAAIVAERLLAVLRLPYKLGLTSFVSTASIGIVTSEYGHERAEDVLRDADTAMYEAKLHGRARAVFFDSAMRDRVRRKLQIENGLRKALELGQFLLHYQPIVSLESGRIEGFECLLRWQHPEHGLIMPGEFIPVAEETGLIVPLGEWVFREACRQLAVWWTNHGRESVPSLSVNLSRHQLASPSLPERLRDLALEAGVTPSAIHLEVTESAIMDDAKLAAALLQEIKAIGFKLDVDDFGTGYSSLACLHQFPIDVLKIDRSFIAGLGGGVDLAALVNAIVTLTRNLGIRVVAEGVETADQLSMLQALGCEFAQGYFFARPMPGEQVIEFSSKFHSRTVPASETAVA